MCGASAIEREAIGPAGDDALSAAWSRRAAYASTRSSGAEDLIDRRERVERLERTVVDGTWRHAGEHDQLRAGQVDGRVDRETAVLECLEHQRASIGFGGEPHTDVPGDLDVLVAEQGRRRGRAARRRARARRAPAPR